MSDIDNANPSAQWSEVDGSNTAPAPDGFPQAGSPAQDLWVDVPANGRALMGAIKRFWDRINGTVTTTGSAGAYAYAVANTSFPTAYVQGETYTFKAFFTSVGGDTLNINGLGAMPLYKSTPGGLVPIVAGDVQIHQIVQAVYDSGLNGGAGGFQLVGGVSAAPSQAIPTDAGILTYASATSILFSPRNGGYIKVNGVLVPIPSTGLSIANTGVEVGGVTGQNLAAGTTYDVYLKIVSGTLTPSFYVDSGGGTHMTDTTSGNVGVEVRNNGGSPDSTRSLVGKIRTNGSGQFQDGGPIVGVISWFNRTNKRPFVSSTPILSSTSLAEISTALRVSFLSWGDDTPWGVCDGQWQVLNQPMTNELQSSVDGIQYGSAVATAFTANSAPACFSSHWTVKLAEGWHTSSPYGFVSSGTAETDTYNWANVTG